MSILQTAISGSASALNFIKAYLANPVIGAYVDPGTQGIGPVGVQVVSSLSYPFKSAGVLIEPEQYTETQRADVSAQMILSVDGTKRYIADNVALQPRSWTIVGYIPGSAIELSGLYMPTLKIRKGYLQEIYNSRAVTSFKTREGEYLNVVIESMEFDTRPDVMNKIPISIVLKEVDVLDVEMDDPNAPKPIPASGTKEGSVLNKGSASPFVRHVPGGE